jgi:hypothetical protein
MQDPVTYTETPQQSFAAFVVDSLGINVIVLPLLGLLLFAGGLIVIFATRRPGVIAACLAFVPLPVMIGMMSMFKGAIDSFSVIAMSSAAPKPAEIAAGVATALVNPFCAILCTLPGYFVLAAGLLFRTITARRGNESGGAH